MTIPDRLLALAASALLAGCVGSFVPDDPELYTLSQPEGAAPAPAAGAPRVALDIPSAPAALDTSRIVAELGPNRRDFVSGAAWSDRAPVLVQRRLQRAFELDGTVAAAVGDDATVGARYVLALDLRAFQAAYPGAATDTAPTARIALQAHLLTLPGRESIAQREFTAERSAASPRLADIVAAFDAATARISDDLVAWTNATLPIQAGPAP